MEQLVRAAQRGEPSAIDALVRELAPYAGRICGAIALDRGDDALQETLIAVIRNIRSLREPAALHGWVRRIAVREAVRVARVHAAALGQGHEPVAALPDIDTAVDVRKVLDGLPPDQRAVLVLRHVDGLTEAEAAAVLGVPHGTVKSRLSRARAEFARRWDR